MAAGGRSMSAMSEETFDLVCTACYKENRTLEAVRYCVECLGYCCQVCTDLHSRFPALQNHNLLDVGQGNQDGDQRPRLPEFPTERCNLHQGKVLDMFCEHHNEVVCYMCVVTQHKSCSENSINPVPDMIDNLCQLDDCTQIQSRLSDMLVSMSKIGQSHGSLLKVLKNAKNVEKEKVLVFQKVLESIIRKAAEASLNEIENKYIELEKEILQEKQDVTEKEDSLKKYEEKLKNAMGNRAQYFVCTKLAEKQMLEADNQMFKQKLNYYKGIQLQFTPNQTLIDYVNGLNGIGEIAVTLKKKQDMYTVKGGKDINAKSFAGVSGNNRPDRCCVSHDHQLLVTDSVNNKLHRFDIRTLTPIDYCSLDSAPYGVVSINKDEAVIACDGNKVQFVSLGDKMAPTRQVQMHHCCYGISACNDQLYITDRHSKLHIHDMSGKLIKSVSEDFSGANHVTFDTCRNKMYVSNWGGGIVCIDDVGNHLCSFTDSALRNLDGVCVDGRGNIFVVGHWSHNVVQFNEDGKMVGVVIKEQDGLYRPCSICYDPKLNRLFVGMVDNDVVKMYELE